MRIIVTLIALFLFRPQISQAQNERDFVTDRPGATDNPITMTPGHFRVETGIYTFSRNEFESTTTTNQTFGSFVFVLGLTDQTEIQLGLNSLVQNEVKAAGSKLRSEEFGDTNLRLKYNILGNDGGDIALGVIPRLSYTGKLNGSEFNGGVALPLAVNLPKHWSFSVMPQWDYSPGENNSVNEFFFGMNLGRKITDSLGGSMNFSTTSSEESSLKAKFGPGFAYQLRRNVQLDCGLRLGITEAASDIDVTFGIVYWP